MHTARKILAVSAILTTAHLSAHGAGLNTDVALTPPEGGTIVRAQWRYSEFSSDPTPAGREVRLHAFPLTFVHGFTSDFAILGTLPTVRRTMRMSGPGEKLRDTGIADIPMLGKYRFYQNDQPGRTTRWALVGGAELPSFDSVFSSESVDPIVGTVWTHQQLEWWVDGSLTYQFNTAGGLNGDDLLQASAAGSYPLMTGQGERVTFWGLYAIGEINALYLTDGSTETFISPGLQLITAR